MLDDKFDRHFDDIREAQKSALKTARWAIPMGIALAVSLGASLMVLAAFLIKWVAS